LRFDTKAAVPKLFFKHVRWLEDDEYDIVVEKGQSASAKQAITMTVAKTTEKPLQLEGAKPTAKAKVGSVEVETDDDVDEPEKRKPAVKASAVPQKKASNLASTVDEWDD
jgi:hypothetical protein